MHAHEHVVVAGHLAAHEREVLDAVEQRLEHVGREVAVLGRDPSLGDATDQLLVLAPILDHLGDRDHQQVVLFAEPDEIRHPGHGPVVLDDLAQHAGRVAPGHAGQVDGRLGVAGPLQHAALGVAQRKDVAGPGQIARSGGRIAQGPNGGGPVGGRDARRRAVDAVDRIGERSAVRLGVVPHHQRNVELVESIAGQWRADHPRGVAHEEGDLLGRGVLGRHDQVTLVLTVLVVDDDHDLPSPNGRDGILDGSEDRALVADRDRNRFVTHC